MIFHVDANSFYASCESLFRPDLEGKGIIVLSNNDGIVIALNDEAKKAGFKRGDVWYKICDDAQRKGVVTFSSNYTLYADMSARLVAIYTRLCPDVEVYSIDESFLYYPDWHCPDFPDIARHLRATVLKETGLPVSVGIAPTRTLAKLCNKMAKKNGGVFSWTDIATENDFACIPAADIWGIGWAKAKALKRHGIATALDLKHYPLHLAKKHLTVTGMRTVQELNGIPAIGREEREKHKNICSSRSFAEPVTLLCDLEEALSSYTHEAVRRMREQGSAARYISVYLMTNPWDDAGPQQFTQLSAEMEQPSAFLPDILDTALGLLRNQFKEGYRYRKVMVNLLGLVGQDETQPDLFRSTDDSPSRRALMECFDALEKKYGRDILHVGSSTLLPRAWNMKRKFLSPAYTTDVRALPEVH